MPAQAPARSPEGTASARDGSLPVWNLADLYPAMDAPAIEADFAAAARDAKALNQACAGRVAAMSGAELAAAIAEYERIDEVLGRLLTFSQLLFAADSTNAEIARFAQSGNERATTIGSDLLFLTLELNRMEDDVLAARMRDRALAHWQPWLRDLRVFRPHQLSDEVEKLLHEKDVTGRGAWNRLFDETIAGLRVKLDGRELTVSEALNRLSDRDRAVREAAGLVHDAGGLLVSDAVQAMGRIEATLDDLCADALFVSAHKLGGPKGIGALAFARPDLHIEGVLIRGGGQERGLRSGTENVAAIAGFGAVAGLPLASRSEREALAARRDGLEQALRARIADVRIFGAEAARLPNTSCFAIPGVSAETLLIALDLGGFALSSGSACSSGKVRPSHVLAARFSFRRGKETTGWKSISSANCASKGRRSSVKPMKSTLARLRLARASCTAGSTCHSTSTASPSGWSAR